MKSDMDMRVTPGVELKNDMIPGPRAPMHYGPQYVPHPTNAKAKLVNAARIMDEVLRG